jgi:hypothetical protein
MRWNWDGCPADGSVEYIDIASQERVQERKVPSSHVEFLGKTIFLDRPRPLRDDKVIF